MAESNQETLDQIAQVLPKIAGLFLSDIGISMTDREKFILYVPGQKMDLKIVPGTVVKPGFSISRAMDEKRRVTGRLDKAIYGQTLISIAIPILNSTGQVIGALCAYETVEKQESLKEMAGTLTDSISTLAATTEQISAQAQEISNVSGTLAKVAQESQSRAQNTNEVLGIIRNISAQTNLLGLNAAIEAARVGDQGRGFGVVAEEIRKLAAVSTDSVKNIDAVLKMIQSDSRYMSDEMTHINAIIAQVASAVSQVADTVQQVNAAAQQLSELAEHL